METQKPEDDGVTSASSPDVSMRATAARPKDAPRRCFICLTDQEPYDPPGSWVDPCPCTLEAHQDCMLSWVTDCERSNKPLQCPVCKAMIELEGPWDLVVAAKDLVRRRFSRASPYILFAGVSMGVQCSLQMYGALALWTFAGKETLMRAIFGPDMVIDGRSVRNLQFVRERLWNALVLMNVAPTLLFGRLLPTMSNKVFLPIASAYGMFHAVHQEDFLSWPPSPQLAFAVFPYIRSAYYNLWGELVQPYENRLHRQLLGLPPPQEEQQRPPHERQGNEQQDGHVNGERPVPQQNPPAGFLGLLQGLLNALDPDDEEQLGNAFDQIDAMHDNDEPVEGRGEREEIVVELQIAVGENVAVPQDAEVEAPDVHEPAEEMAHGLDEQGDAAELEPQGQIAEGNAADDGPENAAGHEAPPAPPRRVGIGGILSKVSDAIVDTLIMPGISFAMGELLRFVLPQSWTSVSSSRTQWRRLGVAVRPGLLQQQWGRSLVGGCLYVVLADVIRVYTQSRRAAAMGKRRVKNVERRRKP